MNDEKKALPLGGLLLLLGGVALVALGIYIFSGSGTSPAQAEELYKQARALYESRDLYKAETLIKRAIEARPDQAAYHDLLGKVLEQEGEFRLSETSYEMAVKLAPDDPEPLLNLANIEHKLGKPEERLKRLEELVEKFPEHIPGLYQLGEFYFSRAEFEKSAHCFEKIVAIQPEVEAMNNLAAAYYTLNRLEEAGELFKMVLEKEPNFESAKEGLENVKKKMEESQP